MCARMSAGDRSEGGGVVLSSTVWQIKIHFMSTADRVRGGFITKSKNFATNSKVYWSRVGARQWLCILIINIISSINYNGPSGTRVPHKIYTFRSRMCQFIAQHWKRHFTLLLKDRNISYAFFTPTLETNAVECLTLNVCHGQVLSTRIHISEFVYFPSLQQSK